MGEGLAGDIGLTVLGALLGVAGTYIFDLRKAQREQAARNAESARDRSRLRSTVATALLQDMRLLECQLSEIYYFETASRYVPSRHRLYFDSHAGDVRLFAAPTVHVLTEFYRRYYHVLSAYDLLPRLKDSGTRSPAELEHELRSQAGYALQSLPAAVQSLRDEGGLVNETEEWSPVLFPQLPEVPAPVFEATKQVVEESRRENGARGV